MEEASCRWRSSCRARAKINRGDKRWMSVRSGHAATESKRWSRAAATAAYTESSVRSRVKKMEERRTSEGDEGWPRLQSGTSVARGVREEINTGMLVLVIT